MLIWIYVILFVGFVVTAAVCDIRSLRIPNRLTAAMAAGGPLATWLCGAGAEAVPAALLAGGVTLCIGWALFEVGVLGGGDAKLATAVALWLGPQGTLVFAFATALVGGLLAVALLVLSRVGAAERLVGRRWRERLKATSIPVPYAVAMAPAGIAALINHIATAV